MACDRCALLEARLREYRIRYVLGTAPNVARILAALYAAHPRGRSAQGLLNETRRKDRAKPGTLNLARVYVHHAREIVGKEGIDMQTGIYRLTKAGKDALDEMLA
jgi:hypothetical protein